MQRQANTAVRDREHWWGNGAAEATFALYIVHLYNMPSDSLYQLQFQPANPFVEEATEDVPGLH